MMKRILCKFWVPQPSTAKCAEGTFSEVLVNEMNKGGLNQALGGRTEQLEHKERLWKLVAPTGFEPVSYG